MCVTLIQGDPDCRLVLRGRLVRGCLGDFEKGIIDAMRRYPRLEVDLSGVQEIDGCGIRLVQSMRTLGGEAIDIVAAPPKSSLPEGSRLN